MIDSREPEYRRERVARSYSSVFQTMLSVCALAIALLPVPVTLFRLLPSYQVHARFLVFYAPLVCLLILGYLFYIRDFLARVMFGRLLRPAPAYDPYRRRRPGEAARAAAGWITRTVVAVLPALLVLASFYCVMQYNRRLAESVSFAMASPAAPAPAPAADERRDRARSSRPPQRPASDSGRTHAPPREARQQLLLRTGIDGIPFFTELTVLYIGSFAAALVATFLMALKEYAKNAMGLSEADLIRGSAVDDSR